MPTARSTTYPSLIVADLDVRFTDGEAEVTADQAKALREAGIDGVTILDEKPASRGSK